MATFAAETFKLFYPTLSKFGFRKALAASGSERATLVAKADDEICFYLFVTDGRSKGGDVGVVLWLAPQDFPGDALDKLGVGLKIEIASQFEIDDAFMEAAARKVAHYVPIMRPIAKAVWDEFINKPNPSKRLEFYRVEREYFKKLQEIVASSENQIVGEMSKAVTEAAKSGKRGYEKLESFLSKLMEDFDQSGRLPLPTLFKPVPANVRGTLIAGHFYVQSIMTAPNH